MALLICNQIGQQPEMSYFSFSTQVKGEEICFLSVSIVIRCIFFVYNLLLQHITNTVDNL